jgi:SAM-dependent methyltransferase
VLYQLAIGHYLSRALFVAARLGLADLLAEGPREVSHLAKASGTHAPSLRRLLRLLASADVFEELGGGRFALQPLGDALRREVPGSARALVLLFAGGGVQDSWRELEWCVRTGAPAYRRDAPDAQWVDALAGDPEAGAIFDEAMATFAPQLAVAVVSAYDFSGCARIADVGGGNGALLTGILNANPGLRGILFDLPDVVARARSRLASAGMAERCDLIGGSFFEEVPRGADLYLLKHVIHDWDDERATQILANVRSALSPGGRLLVVEGIYPERIDSSAAGRGAAANDVNMLVVTGGRQRSEAEFRELYRAAGFRLERVVPTLSASASLVEGIPA